MTLEQQVHQNDVKLNKVIREIETLKRQVAMLIDIHSKDLEDEALQNEIEDDARETLNPNN